MACVDLGARRSVEAMNAYPWKIGDTCYVNMLRLYAWVISVGPRRYRVRVISSGQELEFSRSGDACRPVQT